MKQTLAMIYLLLVTLFPRAQGLFDSRIMSKGVEAGPHIRPGDNGESIGPGGGKTSAGPKDKHLPVK